MRLSQLQLSGFKSFAKPTRFEFIDAITAIVGPNGSGKSNVAEGIRWALGEQSMKSLRGKRGEDLIFNGSPAVPRMGKASVKLIFDNRDGKIPLDFDEVIFERKIFRDGMNEYYLNNSQVRLKDVVELLARMGLGETKHNIIGQGEVDRILLSGSRERREMLEEAIGLRVYQLKKAEAERKLEETSKNIVSAQSLLKEIAPHLKFLRTQAEKAENRGAIEQSLREIQMAWLKKSREQITEELKRLEHEHGPEEKKLADLEEEIKALEEEAAALESALGKSAPSQQLDEKITPLEQERQKLVRELGRIEGKLEMEANTPAALQRSVDAGLMRRHLNSILERLEEVHVIDDLDEVRERIESLIASIESILAEIEEHSLAAANGKAAGKTMDMEEAKRSIQEKLARFQAEIESMRETDRKEFAESTELRQTLLKYERALREKEEERNDLRSALQRWLFEKERIEEKRRELGEEEFALKLTPQTLETFDINPFSSENTDDLKKKIEKYRLKLEEIGGIDPLVVKEYQDTKSRHEFLEREINDLESASRDLKFLVKELEETMERDFESGFAKIKEEFNNYFRIIFGGGKGILKYAPLRERAAEEEGEAGEGPTEYGIEIDVDVPRKRIQSLSMLSGGERALASIALLFAITAVNPPPFLVLDETDAALDEANSQKYAAILRELSKKTQLMIITHNRETMKQAGVLYGVTMAADGVSKLLSLKLEEAEVYTNR